MYVCPLELLHFAHGRSDLGLQRRQFLLSAGLAFGCSEREGAEPVFEPGQSRSVRLVAIAGKREVYGFRQEVMGKV